MFTRVTIALLFFVAAKAADTAANAQKSAGTAAQQREQRRQQEKKEAQTAATNLAATVQKDRAQVVQAMTALKDFKQTLSNNYNSTQCQAHAQRIAKAAHDARESQRRQMRTAFTTAHKMAEDKRAQLDDATKNMASATAATAASLRERAQDTDSAMGAQLELMATKIDAIRKLDHEERRDARHRLQKLQDGLRETARTHVKAAHAAVRHLEKSSKDLEREQRRAGDSEQTYEGTKEKNEQMWESYKDQVENIADDLQDSIGDIHDRVEDPLEHEIDSTHDQNERDVAALRHQYHHTVEKASQARHSLTQANEASERMLAKSVNTTNTKDDASILLTESWWNVQAPACVAAIFIGTAAAFVVDSFQRRRRVSSNDGFDRLMA